METPFPPGTAWITHRCRTRQVTRAGILLPRLNSFSPLPLSREQVTMTEPNYTWQASEECTKQQSHRVQNGQLLKQALPQLTYDDEC